MSNQGGVEISPLQFLSCSIQITRILSLQDVIIIRSMFFPVFLKIIGW